MKIGIFGGTFNPPHNTHIEMVKQSQSQLGLDITYVLPNYIPPHKSCNINYLDRLNMTRLAFKNLSVTIDEYEINRGGNSYTYLTLEHYRALYPRAEFYLIIGGDSFRNFDKWVHPELIAKMATLAVCVRPNSDFEQDKIRIESLFGAKIVQISMELSDISSTRIRVDYQFGKTCNLVPPQVNQYIIEHKLYRNYSDMVERVRGMLSEYRFSHTYYVVLAGLKLWELTRLDRDKVFVACLLHDVAKDMREDDYAKYDYDSKGINRHLVHAPLGAIIAKRDFGINDQVILDAILYHTTGRPNMTEMDMLVYTADKIEESRPYPTAHLWGGSLLDIFLRCIIEATAENEKRRDKEELDPMSYKTIDFYKKRRNK